MANLKNINFMSGTQFTNLETTKEDELYAVNIENDATFKSFVSGMGMPSARYVDLTLGASGSTYTAPANGYVNFAKKATVAKQEIALLNDTALLGVANQSVGADWMRIYMPANKGDVIRAQYTAAGDLISFRFVYAEGENN